MRIAVTWLNQEQPTEATPLQLVLEQAKTQPLAAHGEIGNGRKDESRADNVRSTGFGNSQAYLLRRIARDQPELLDQIGPDKEFRSVRAAAIKAGIIKPVPIVRLVADMAVVASKLRQALAQQQLLELINLLAPPQL